jgi:hypothetical protein
MTDRVSTNPLAALAATTGDYELSVWVEFHLAPCPRTADGGRDIRPTVAGSYVISGGLADGRWHLTLHERLGEEPDGDEGDVADVLGPTLLDLRGQALGAHPSALLRALKSGGAA